MNEERNISLELAASGLPIIPYIILKHPSPAVGEPATALSSTTTKLSDALDVADNDDYIWFNNSTAMFLNWTSLQDVSSSTADFVEDPLSGYPYPSHYSWPHIIFASVIVTLIMLAIIFGNGLVVVAIAVDRGLRGLQNWFVASLAVSDLLVGLFIMPLTLTNELVGYWPFGNVICELWLSTDVLLCTASILNLCLISLDRYWSIVRPIAYVRARTPRRAAAMISVVWVLSMAICLPPVVGWKRPQPILYERYPLCVLSEEPGYIIYSSIGSFYLPLIVMVLVYFKIYLAARERARRNLKKSPHGGAACSSSATSAALEHKNMANNKAEKDATGRKSASTVLPLIVAQNSGSPSEGQSQMSDIRIEPDSYVDLDSGCTEGEDAYLRIVNSHHVHEPTGAEQSSAAIDVSVAIVTKNSDDDEESGFMAVDLGEKSPKSNSGSTFTRVGSGSKSRPTIEYHLVPGGNISDNDNADELNFTPVDIDRNYLEITSKADVQTLDHHGDADSRRSLLKSPAAESSGRCSMSSKPGISSSSDVTGKSQTSTIFNSKRFSISLSLSPNSALSTTAGGGDVKEKQRRHSALAIPKTFFRSNSNSSQNGSSVDLTTGCGQSNLNGKLSSASDLPDPERTKRKLARARERRATVVLGIVMASFIGCWLPFFAIYPATALAGVEVPPSLFAVIFWLGYCNSALNPIIYTIFNRDFRAAFGNILCRARRRQSAAARGKRRSTTGRV